MGRRGISAAALHRKIVEKLGLHVQVFLENVDLMMIQDKPNLAFGIEQVAEFPCTHRAGFHTRWIAAQAGALQAESAFLDHSYWSRAIA